MMFELPYLAQMMYKVAVNTISLDSAQKEAIPLVEWALILLILSYLL